MEKTNTEIDLNQKNEDTKQKFDGYVFIELIRKVASDKGINRPLTDDDITLIIENTIKLIKEDSVDNNPTKESKLEVA